MHGVRRIVLPLAAMLTVSLSSATHGAEPPAELLDLEAYAEFYGVDIATVKAELELTDAVRDLQVALVEGFPEEFAGLWVAHDPDFSVHVAMTADLRAEVASLGRQHGVFEITTSVHALSVKQLEELAAEVSRYVSVTYSLNIDIRTNNVDLEVLAHDSANVAAGLKRLATNLPMATVLAREGPDALAVTVAPHLGGPAADIYGGLTLKLSNGNNECTAGFSVRKNSTTLTGILTAGHCADSLYYNGTHLPGYEAHAYGNYDAQWHTTPGYADTNRIRTNPNGATRSITSVRTYAATVVGETVCKYGYAGGYGCGVIESKSYQPSWIPDANPVFIHVNNCGVDLVNGGDSGGPVFYLNRAYGITSGFTWGGVGCGADKLVFNSQTHAAGRNGVTIITS